MEVKQRCEFLQSLFDITLISGIITVFDLYYQHITKVMFFETPYSRLSTFHSPSPGCPVRKRGSFTIWNGLLCLPLNHQGILSPWKKYFSLYIPITGGSSGK
jgi:hypothetical protein